MLIMYSFYSIICLLLVHYSILHLIPQKKLFTIEKNKISYVIYDYIIDYNH